MTRPTVDMMEALRLTRQGKLEEAMAVLRGAPPAAEAAPGRATGTATVIDMVPPSDQSGSAWTAAPTGGGSRRQPTSRRRNVVFDRLRPRKRRPNAEALAFAERHHRRCLQGRRSKATSSPTRPEAGATSFMFRAATRARPCRSS